MGESEEEDAESEREEEEMGNRLQDNSVFGKIDLFLDQNVNLNKSKGSGRSRSEGWTNFSDCESESPKRHRERILEQGLARNKAFLGSGKPTAPSRGRPRSAPARTGAPLHRAHSCGSLKSRQGVGSGFWDILSDKSAPITILSQREVKAGSGVPKPGELTLTLTSVSAPLSLLHLQSG